MAKKSKDGKWIIAAGEIAEYTVCPEAWRLSQKLRKSLRVILPQEEQGAGGKLGSAPSSQQARIKKGMELHEDWAANILESQGLLRGVRFILLLLALAILIFVISSHGGVHA